MPVAAATEPRVAGMQKDCIFRMKSCLAQMHTVTWWFFWLCIKFRNRYLKISHLNRDTILQQQGKVRRSSLLENQQPEHNITDFS